MRKYNKIKTNIKLICWDLDGTLFDTEYMWYHMDDIVKEKYGKELSRDEINKYSEEVAAEAYKNWGYRANADKALNYYNKKNIKQIVINKCDLTNQTMYKNETVNKQFNFNNFDYIISELDFKDKYELEDMYKLALKKYKISNPKEAIAICDMPFELEAAKNVGLTTIWAKNKDYPFTEQELEIITKVSDYYIEDFSDLK